MHVDWLSLIEAAGGVMGLLLVTIGPLVFLVWGIKTGRFDLIKKNDEELDAQSEKLRAMQEREIELLKDEVARLREAFAELQGKVVSMQEQQRLQDEQHKLQMATKEAELSRLHGENSELRDEKQRLYARNANHEIKMEQLERQNEALRRARRRTSDVPVAGDEDLGPEKERL